MTEPAITCTQESEIDSDKREALEKAAQILKDAGFEYYDILAGNKTPGKSEDHLGRVVLINIEADGWFLVCSILKQCAKLLEDVHDPRAQLDILTGLVQEVLMDINPDLGLKVEEMMKEDPGEAHGPMN
ncbi:hypothetical protein [uncultured Acidaminococcus sp.]|uniref:hypothetical protein n=1 Tax=uncultured Acidaminococcus sp. TaxID=352152 RepID=UPI0026DAD036|nr:hypothetical protein [uncultured Acidaminococcus sp.]